MRELRYGCAVGRENRFHSDALPLYKLRSGSKLGKTSLRTGGIITVFMEICFLF